MALANSKRTRLGGDMPTNNVSIERAARITLIAEFEDGRDIQAAIGTVSALAPGEFLSSLANLLRASADGFDRVAVTSD